MKLGTTTISVETVGDIGFRSGDTLDFNFFDLPSEAVNVEIGGRRYVIPHDQMEQLVEAWNTAEQKRLKELVGTSL